VMCLVSAWASLSLEQLFALHNQITDVRNAEVSDTMLTIRPV